MFQLRPYQIDLSTRAAEILRTHGLVYLAMECRTGKTTTALQTAANIGSFGVLFVTPKKAIPSVERDYAMMKADNPHIFSIKVTNYEDILAKEKSIEKTSITIVQQQYPSISRKGVKFARLCEEEKSRQRTLLAPYLTPDKFDVLIIDEAHRTSAFPKPSGSQQALRSLAKGKKVIYLSGTPTPEGSSQIYHQLQISEHSPFSQWPTFYKWAHHFVNIQPKMINGIPTNDYSDCPYERVKPYLDPIMLTFTQEEAGFESLVEERIIRVSMLDSTRQAMTALRRDRVTTIGTHTITADTPADLINKLHQLSGGTLKLPQPSDPSSVPTPSARVPTPSPHAQASPSPDRLILDASKASYLLKYFYDRHYAIFYVYKAERDLLISVLGEDRITESPEAFQSDPSKIFIGQIRSVREGVRLDTAEFSVFYSTEFSYVSYAQGLQRIASKERTAPAIVYFMTSQCRIEQSIIDAVHDKQDFTLQYYNHHKPL